MEIEDIKKGKNFVIHAPDSNVGGKGELKT